MNVKNWSDFQHYRDGRTVQWIKLYRTLLDNFDFAALSGDDAKVLVLCWLVAAEKDGELPDVAVLAYRLRMDPRKLGTSLRNLADKGFLESVPSCTKLVQKNTDTPAVLLPREREETEGETETEERQSCAPAPTCAVTCAVDRDAAFDAFWRAYPCRLGVKPGKTAARKAWAKLDPVGGLLDTIMAAVEAQKNSRQWLDKGGQFIPHASTWLNQARWEDEVADNGKQCGDGSPVPFEER